MVIPGKRNDFVCKPWSQILRERFLLRVYFMSRRLKAGVLRPAISECIFKAKKKKKSPNSVTFR